MEQKYEDFKILIHKTIGINLNAYKEQQMRRRIMQWLARYKMASLDDLLNEIRNNPDHRDRFTQYLTINTSQFFRDTNVFSAINSIVIPDITQAHSSPRVWSAGCSIGAEIYSIVMLFAEGGYSAGEFFASDLDGAVLDKARRGVYSSSEVTNVPPNLLNKYFRQEGEKYIVSERIRNQVRFQQHDLLKDHPRKNCDLILCRNVFIYFTNETQKNLIRYFAAALLPGGYFIVGSAEHIMEPKSFGLERVSYCIYKKSRE